MHQDDPAAATSLDTRPLVGLRVLDLSRLLPGPYLSLVLADMGADVVKIEAPGGGDWVRWLPPLHGGQSVPFIALNRGKRSVSLDLKRPGGSDVLKRLAGRADILVESFRPGVMDRLGVGWDVLRAVNPRLIYCAITGYGQVGPYRLRAGHDLNYIALSGALAMTGRPGEPPTMPGVQLADVAGGGLFGAVGVLAALHARQATGQGRFVDVSMTEGALALNALTLPNELAGAQTGRRGTNQLNGASACYQVYETKDGGFVSLAALEPKFWAAFCSAVEKPEWRGRHMGDDEAMKAEIAALVSSRTRDEWAQAFADVDACLEPVLELEELRTHPQHEARGVFFELDQGDGGPITQARTPLMRPGDSGFVGPAPKLGADTRTVLGEAGYDGEAIDALVEARVVAQAR